jgi:hemin uptake protein HemP
MAHALNAKAERPAPTPQVVESREILAGARKIQIRHGDDLYTLQVTRQGKLLLTK